LGVEVSTSINFEEPLKKNNVLLKPLLPHLMHHCLALVILLEIPPLSQRISDVK